MHYGNNIYALIFLSSVDSSVNTPALFRIEGSEWGPIMPTMAAALYLAHYVCTFTWLRVTEGRHSRR